MAVDPTFGHDETWGIGTWIWYTSVWWLPGLLTVVTALALVAGGATRVGRGNRRARLTDVMANGRRTTGEVTAISGGTTPDASRTLLRWTFAFVDLHGVRRWVERTEGFTHGAAPVLGGTVTVLYDPARPGDRSASSRRPAAATSPRTSCAPARRDDGRRLALLHENAALLGSSAVSEQNAQTPQDQYQPYAAAPAAPRNARTPSRSSRSWPRSSRRSSGSSSASSRCPRRRSVVRGPWPCARRGHRRRGDHGLLRRALHRARRGRDVRAVGHVPDVVLTPPGRRLTTVAGREARGTRPTLVT